METIKAPRYMLIVHDGKRAEGVLFAKTLDSIDCLKLIAYDYRKNDVDLLVWSEGEARYVLCED